jgi:hypothetical protein
MIVCSFNIRGLGSRVKRNKIRDLVKDHNLDFLAIQETKMEEMSDVLCYSLWGSRDVGWLAVPSRGNSGGLLSLWNKDKYSLVFLFTGEDFAGVCLNIIQEQRICYVLNVYAKCDLVDRRSSWDCILMSKRGFGGDLWCVVGDFNSVRTREEKRGLGAVTLPSNGADFNVFNNFIAGMELVEIPLFGRTFTWSHPNGVSMSKLDRFLLSEGWVDTWTNPVVWALPRDVSDHCPIILRYNDVDWGPRPFRFKNFWLENSSFKDMVSKVWEEQHFTGWMGHILKERLKGLKLEIKKWNTEVYGEVDLKIQKLRENIEELDLRSERKGISDDEVLLRKGCFTELWKLLKSKDALNFQKSRAKWLKKGDANSNYFHACVKNRGRQNSIKALRVSDGWIEGVDNIKAETVRFFTNHFSASAGVRPLLNGIQFPLLSEAENALLIVPFSMEEIEAVVKDSDGNKSPGPDGFNFTFIKEFWGLMRGEFRIMFDQFYGNASLPKGILSYFLTLIPKVKNPEKLGDYRPISLLGCIYKLLSKVLAARLAKVMGSIISASQSAFLKGRQLVDGVLVLNEVVDSARKTGKECLIFKVDFEKAYDSVDWNFLVYMLHRFGFNDLWIKWMKACVCSGKMSVLINGCPTEEINISRGLKQGDPLAPFLFLLVAEGLGAIMRNAVGLNRFSPFAVGSGDLTVSHLQYADDTVFVGEAKVENLWTMKAILRGFELASGLKVNFWKSCLVGVNVSNNFMEMASRFLNCRIGRTPFKYLGLPVGANPRRLATWYPMIEVLKNRLNSWGNRYLSLGGRIVLLNSVLSAIPIFYLSIMKMPVKVWKEVVKIQREFLWCGLETKRKISWVNWETVTKPKCDGGLGVRDVRRVNLSLLAKWRWRFLNADQSCWKVVLQSKYGDNLASKHLQQEHSEVRLASIWWKDICKLEGNDRWLTETIVKKVGNGRSTSLWTDAWLGNFTLKDRFPRLYSISIAKDVMVAEAGLRENDNWRWALDWRRNLFVWEHDLLNELMLILNAVSLSATADRWVWLEDSSGDFSVNSCYCFLAKRGAAAAGISEVQKLVFHGVWKIPAPLKVTAFSWQAFLDKIPTKSNLIRRGVALDVTAIGCNFCSVETESSIHLLLHCSLASTVWYKVCRWL